MSSNLLRGCFKVGSSLIRSSPLQAGRQHLFLVSYNGPRILAQPAATITTSKKKQDVTITADTANTAAPNRFAEEAVVKDKKNWVSYGFSWRSEEEDISVRNFIMFVTVTVVMIGVSFQMAYFPDVRMRDWMQREAYVELARREALGLPHIDPDLVPVHQINLPTDEELGDFEIII